MPSHYQQGSNDIKYIVSNRINKYIHVIWLYGIHQAIIMFHIALKYYSIIPGMGSYQQAIFSEHRWHDTLVSGNGPCFTAAPFKEAMKEMVVHHITMLNSIYNEVTFNKKIG